MEQRYITIKSGDFRGRVAVEIAFHIEDKEADKEHVRTFGYNRLKEMMKLPAMIYNFIIKEDEIPCG